MSDEASEPGAAGIDGDAGSLGHLPSVSGFGPGFEGGGVAEPTLPPPGEHPAGQEAKPLSLPQSLVYSAGNLGAGSFYGFNNFVQSFFLIPLGAPPILYGLLNSQRSFEGAFIQPIVGALSDRTWKRLGRRRPFIIRFLPISALFIVLTPFARFLGPLGEKLGWSGTFTALVAVSLCIFIFSVTFNIMYDPYNALLADITTEGQRGGVNGVFQALGAFGQVAIILFGVVLLSGIDSTANPEASLQATVPLFAVTAGLMLITFAISIIGTREPRHLPGVVSHHRYTLRDYWQGLRADREIQIYFAVQFLLWFGINAITPFLTPYATLELHFTPSQALILPLIILLATFISVVPFGALSDRIGLKPVFLIGMIFLAGASIAAIFIRDPLPLDIALAVAGLGNAAQTASSYPLMARLTFPDRIGLYTGLYSGVTSIAAPLSTVITGALIQIIGQRAMFPYVALMFLLSLIPLAMLHVERSAAARARETLGQAESAATSAAV